MPAKKTIKVSTLKYNPDNPSITIDEKFPKLVKSVTDFHKMMTVRKIVIDENRISLGGNKRLAVVNRIIDLIKDDETLFAESPKLRKILLKREIPSDWVVQVLDWTEHEKKQFIIKDNVSFGEWDWMKLSDEDIWSPDELEDWGIDFPEHKSEDYSSNGSDSDSDGSENKMKLVLEFTLDDYTVVKEKLLEIAITPEQAICTLLEID